MLTARQIQQAKKLKEQGYTVNGISSKLSRTVVEIRSALYPSVAARKESEAKAKQARPHKTCIDCENAPVGENFYPFCRTCAMALSEVPGEEYDEWSYPGIGAYLPSRPEIAEAARKIRLQNIKDSIGRENTDDAIREAQWQRSVRALTRKLT